MSPVPSLKLYRRIVDKGEATPAQLMAGILRYAAEVANREQRYIAHPSTWLSQGRWSDEPPAPITGAIDQSGIPESMPPPPNRHRPSESWDEAAFAGMRRGQP